MGKDIYPFKADGTDAFMGYAEPGEEVAKVDPPHELQDPVPATIGLLDIDTVFFAHISIDDEPDWLEPTPAFDQVAEDSAKEVAADHCVSHDANPMENLQDSKSSQRTPAKAKNNTGRKRSPAATCTVCGGPVSRARAYWSSQCKKCDPEDLARRPYSYEVECITTEQAT